MAPGPRAALGTFMHPTPASRHRCKPEPHARARADSRILLHKSNLTRRITRYAKPHVSLGKVGVGEGERVERPHNQPTEHAGRGNGLRSAGLVVVGVGGEMY